MRSSRSPAAEASRHRLPALFVAASLTFSLISCAARRVATPVPQATAPANALSSLRRDLSALFTNNPPGGPVWGVRVESLDRPGEPLFALQPDQLMVPASNMKIVTLAVAADRLGWDRTFPTTFRATTRPAADGSIRGDLVVRGAGDPMIGTLP